MKTNSETGHSKNVANFKDLVNLVSSYGADYNPARASLKIPNLNTIATNAQTSLTSVSVKNTQYNNAVNNRFIAFENLKKLSTRLVNALAVTDAPKQMVDDAKGFNRKLQGQRASAVVKQVNENDPAPVTISASQQSYDLRIQHFRNLITVLESEESYNPNENELKIETLTAKQSELLERNNDVSIAHAIIRNARNARNKTLYEDSNGLVDIALEIKKYVKSAYGANSIEFKQVNAIKFRNIAE
ncbi:hypothetical protein NAT51_17095 [Flavobacterium amniphilum]|uniref:hypothetical protein n=1 Tax=Flavobacterium amniphilum TaxID=1834035 RepID=UPI00202A280D|nr:hypothetical protein [Flavobacterium amniphilum]MCL9807251.1 hypothetical protein [Flavobacterium amniphilum]